MNLYGRAPSTEWESIRLADDAQAHFWAWFRPPGTPQGVLVQVPDETFACRADRPLTLRTILLSLGIDVRQVAMWQQAGVACDAMRGANPALDYAIARRPGADDSTIGIYLEAALPPSAGHFAAIPAANPIALAGAPVGNLLSLMEADWNACQLIEAQLAGARNQLNGMLQRTNSLNRDLSPEETRFADNQDKRDWQETRRWLRDIASRLSRLIKDHDIGMTSTAGRRTWFESVYAQYVAPKRPFEGIEQAHREFEQYRKTLQVLLNNMNSAHGFALQDGERRAQQVLANIASRVRASRAKRG